MKVERYLGCRGTEEAQVGHLEQMRKAHASFLGIFFGAACDAIFQICFGAESARQSLVT